ncbi:hypothetical protein [Gordonia neofelifaecis]|uniref:N-acetyltransferase domain-containing protein n=1 Tax=Gordonia neofelifaecis NRRL B-59395 TaxID=644548 RepID=F1YNR4_9ACTN|nr:hypothetical protein [Gordonia neofelifaecis]EGD53671.1 hypothetical protein SCNU_17802 [Gordonia neofelifaecis NRRL B-59395]
MTTVITLDDNRLEEAVGVLEQGIGEIPLYQWLLGDHVADPAKREWLAELLLRPLLRVGCAVGAEADGRLVGVLAWHPHDVDLSPDGAAPLTPADVEVAVRTPGLRERLLELWTSRPLPLPVDDAVNCMLVALTPEARGGRAVIDMMREVERFCRDHDRPFYAWTGSPPLRDWFVSGWNATEFAVTEWNGVTMYGVVSDRPPVAKPVPRDRDVADRVS